MELKKHCNIIKCNNVETKKKKLNGKAINVWLGIKKIIDIDIDEDDSKNNPLDR